MNTQQFIKEQKKYMPDNTNSKLVDETWRFQYLTLLKKLKVLSAPYKIQEHLLLDFMNLNYSWVNFICHYEYWRCWYSHKCCLKIRYHWHYSLKNDKFIGICNAQVNVNSSPPKPLIAELSEKERQAWRGIFSLLSSQTQPWWQNLADYFLSQGKAIHLGALNVLQKWALSGNKGHTPPLGTKSVVYFLLTSAIYL